MTEIIRPDGEGKGISISRRKFLLASGAAVGAAAVFGVTGFTPGKQAGLQIASAQGLQNDLDVLQFALVLEYLEAAAYRAANASNLLTGQVKEYFRVFGEHENTHVQFLIDAIKKAGATPNVGQKEYNLPKFSSQDDILKFFSMVEEVGAGAYLGAVPIIKDKAVLGAAASIHNVEAQHASVLRSVMNDPMPAPAFGKPMSVDEVLAAVKPLLNIGAPPAPGKFYTIADPAPNVTVATADVAAVPNKADMAFFPETKHTLSGVFLTYWNKNGGLKQFGYPITEPYTAKNPTDGKTYVQQFFQRNRFEYHPEQKGTQFEVQLGLLGAEQLLQAQKCP